MNNQRSLRLSSLRTRLVLAFVLLALFSISILAALNYFYTRDLITRITNQSLLTAGKQLVADLETYFAIHLEEISTSAQSPLIRDFLLLPEERRNQSVLAEEASRILSQWDASQIAEVTYTVLDRKGTVLLDSDQMDLSGVPNFLGLNRLDTMTFQAELLLAGLPYVSPVIYSPNGEANYLYFGARIDDLEGRPIGVLLARHSAQELQDIVLQRNNLAGQGSYGILLDKNFVRIAHGSAPGLIARMAVSSSVERINELQAMKLLPSQLSADDLTRNQSQTDASQLTSLDDPFIEYSEVLLTGGRLDATAAFTKVETQPWSVLFIMPKAIMMQPMVVQARNTALLSLLIAGLTSLAGILTARSLTRPITRLTGTAEQVTQGDLSARADVTRRDEIGRLAQAFNAMTARLQNTLEGLEQRVAERTHDLEAASKKLENRASQLQAVAEVAHAIASVQDINDLLPRITQAISERFGFYHVGIFLVDNYGEYALLKAANSAGGQRMLARGHRLKVGEVGIIGYVTGRGEPRLALDVGQDAVYFDNPDLPETRSEVGLPLKIGGRITGALDVQSTMPAAFSAEDMALFSTLADQVAIAIENARLFSETRQALIELQTSQRQYLQREWARTVAENRKGGYRYIFGSVEPVVQSEKPEIWQALESHQAVVVSQRPSGNGNRPDTATDLSDEESNSLVLPIMVRGQIIGAINLEETDPERKWTEEEINLANAVADQVGLALENARLLEQTQTRAEREHMVSEITSRLRSSNDPQAILEAAMEELRQALRARHARIIVKPKQVHDENPKLERE